MRSIRLHHSPPWRHLLLLILPLLVTMVAAQESPPPCYTGGDIAGAVIGTLLVLALLVGVGYFFWKYYWNKRNAGKQLALVQDAEAGLADQPQYAFDNPGFLNSDDAAAAAAKNKNKPGQTSPEVKATSDSKSGWKDHKGENHKVSKSGGKWQAWSPLSALVGGGSGKQKSESRRTMDDSFVGEPERNVVALRGVDFTGLGFNICGNMRDGIFVRDVLHRGPASESGRISAGDRILGINISFQHMVFEDALTILSYASPYDVQLEVEKGSGGVNTSARDSGSLGGKRSPAMGPTDRLCHPFYRSQSIDDLAKMRRSSLSARRAKIKKTPSDSPGPVGVLGTMLGPGSTPRQDAKLEQQANSAPTDNPRTSRISVAMPKPERAKKPSGPKTPEEPPKVDEKKTSSPPPLDKHTKFGIRVLPTNISDVKLTSPSSPNSSETTQNEQNIKIEQISAIQIDVPDAKLDDKIMDAKAMIDRLEGKTENLITAATMKAQDVVDANIPTELPEEMRLAAMAAKTNRKSLTMDKPVILTVKPEIPAKPDLDFSSGGESGADGENTRKNTKRKAPPPPSTPITTTPAMTANPGTDTDDSDVEQEEKKNKNGGTTIELSSAHITIHQSPKEEEEGSAEASEAAKNRERKTASLGDLSRLESEQPMSIPLERAVSLDMADVNAPAVAQEPCSNTGTAKKRKAPVTPGDEKEDESDEDAEITPHTHYLKKEPRLMDAGMSDTFRRRLKKSSDWGTLEEAMLVTPEGPEEPSTSTSSHQVVLISGSESSVQSPAVSSSKSPTNMMGSDVVSVQVVTSSSTPTPDTPTAQSPPSSPAPHELVTSMSSPEQLADSSTNAGGGEGGGGGLAKVVTTISDLVSSYATPDTEDNTEPPELPTSPMPKAQVSGVREFSLASPHASPVSSFHHSMTYITTTTPSSPQHHVTEIQVLTGGNVTSPAPLVTDNAEPTTTIRHGTSGGNLVLVPSLNLNGPESLEETLSSFTSTHSEVEDMRLDSPTRNNVTVMSINTNGISNSHSEHNNNTQQQSGGEIREVIQITPGELDSVMMSHSHYLRSTQSPENASGSTFEQWVFLDNGGGTPVNGVNHTSMESEPELFLNKSNTTTTMVVTHPVRQSVTQILLEPAEVNLDLESKSKINLTTQTNMNNA